MAGVLSAAIHATCSALGHYDEKTGRYVSGEDLVETVKDLIRYLRRDDETHFTRRLLGDTKVLQCDLLPLLKIHYVEDNLFDVLLRLLVNLTMPPLMLWHEELPIEKSSRNHCLQIEEHLQSYKEAFIDESVWCVLSTKLSKILEIDYMERGEDNGIIIERILLLIRNILYVPASENEMLTDNDANAHDQVLWALHQSGMIDLLLYLACSTGEQAYYMHILEILSLMFRDQTPSKLANAIQSRGHLERIADEAKLVDIRHRESIKKQQKSKVLSSRHSRFGGTFVVKSMKSISDNELIYHKPLQKLESLNFDAASTTPKQPKNRRPMIETVEQHTSPLAVRLFLKEFCVEFLNGAYNYVMHRVKENLVRGKAQSHDESYYLWALRFFMEFNRCHKFQGKLISETMSIQTFHYVQQQCENYYDLISTDKKKLRLWSKRLHLSLLAYRELFHTLYVMDKSSEQNDRDISNVIKSNIFYVLEYREFILTLLVNYDELKMSDVYLRDLMETQHIFLRMLEYFCTNQGTVIVQKRAAKKRKSKKKAKAETSAATSDIAEPQSKDLNLEEKWDEAAPQVSVVLAQSGDTIKADVMPFDAASDTPVDDQKSEAMKNIQRKLRNGNYEEAIGLLRASREVWPENDSFGSHNMAPEEEFLALREIFFADLGENYEKFLTPPTDNVNKEEEESFDEENDEEEEDDGGYAHYAESDFKFNDFTKRLAHPKIIRACGLVLNNFETNPINTNLCTVKLLHRIAFDCKMYVMLFQVSIFRTFQKIYIMKDLPQNKELVKFATYIIRQFFKIAENNKKVFMEALFWKSSKEAYEIENGYGVQQESKAMARAWTEHEEDELRCLFVEHQRNNIDEDIVDWIISNLVDNTKTRRAVLKKLKEMCLLSDYKGRPKKSGIRTKIPQAWGAEEETQLQELYDQFKDANDPLKCIMERLEISRPKNRIIEKLLVMGLIQDRKELRKKRSNKSDKSKSMDKWNNRLETNILDISTESDSNLSDNGSTTSSNRILAGPSKIVKQKKITKKKKIGKVLELDKKCIVENILKISKTSEMKEALNWLKESISDAIEDIEDGSDEGIPLVPIMDYALTAMENLEFQELLKSLGIMEPKDEQEIYWRIPSHLTADLLHEFQDFIEQALNGTLNSQPNSDVLTEKDINSVIENSCDEEKNIVTTTEFNTNKKERKKSRIILNDSSDEEDIAKSEEDIAKSEEEFDKSTKAFEKSGDDMRISFENKENVNKEEINDSKRIRSISDSDDERRVSKKTRFIESSEDEC